MKMNIEKLLNEQVARLQKIDTVIQKNTDALESFKKDLHPSGALIIEQFKSTYRKKGFSIIRLKDGDNIYTEIHFAATFSEMIFTLGHHLKLLPRGRILLPNGCIQRISKTNFKLSNYITKAQYDHKCIILPYSHELKEIQSFRNQIVATISGWDFKAVEKENRTRNGEKILINDHLAELEANYYDIQPKLAKTNNLNLINESLSALKRDIAPKTADLVASIMRIDNLVLENCYKINVEKVKESLIFCLTNYTKAYSEQYKIHYNYLKELNG